MEKKDCAGMPASELVVGLSRHGAVVRARGWLAILGVIAATTAFALLLFRAWV
jgi:hypothetical protein